MNFEQLLGLTILIPLVLVSACALATDKSDRPPADLFWMFTGTLIILLIIDNLIGG